MGWQVVNAVVLHAGNTIINPDGTFVYSTAGPGAGNLIASIADVAGTDSFGNHYTDGHGTYDNVNGLATSLSAGLVQFYTGSLAGGWTAGATVATDPSGDILLTPKAGRGVLTSLNTLDNGAGAASFSGNVTVAGTLSVSGSTSTGNTGLPDGTIHGTSGPASAGTAHTHSPGSFAVGNGQHSHVL